MIDHALKIFLKRDENFAALFNTFMPNAPNIDENSLSDYDTSSQFTLIDSRGKSVTKEIRRDIIKKTEGKILSLYGIENQTYIDYSMPARMLLYDAVTLAQQAFRIKKNESIIPVVSIVLYYGIKPWKGPTSILEMTKLPKDMWNHYWNYEIRVVDIRRSSKKDLEKLPGDLAYFFEFMQKIAKKEEFEDFIRETSDRILNLREDTLLALNSFVGVDSEIEGGDTMKGEFQKVLDYQLDKGKAVGRAEGKAEERLNSTRYFKEQMEQLGINQTKIDEIIRNFENTK